MAKLRKLLDKLLSGSKDIHFEEFVALLTGFGFVLDRVRGSHHVFIHPTSQSDFPFNQEKMEKPNLTRCDNCQS